MRYDNIHNIIDIHNNINIYLYIYIYIYIKWCNNSSDSFPVSRGVHQGGIFSPLLFNLYTNPMINKFNEIHSGYCLRGSRT